MGKNTIHVQLESEPHNKFAMWVSRYILVPGFIGLAIAFFIGINLDKSIDKMLIWTMPLSYIAVWGGVLLFKRLTNE